MTVKNRKQGNHQHSNQAAGLCPLLKDFHLGDNSSFQNELWQQ